MNSVGASPRRDESCDLGIINQREETPSFKKYNYVQKSLVHSRFCEYPNVGNKMPLIVYPTFQISSWLEKDASAYLVL